MLEYLLPLLLGIFFIVYYFYSLGYSKGYHKGMREGYSRCNRLFLDFKEHTLEYNKTLLRNLGSCQQLLNNVLRRYT